ncbi:MAG TPA: ornithine carbamoyltransferase [Solirubrobacterales bacterium]|nr:ornithine carbamoyltransferase [Solirubrobacterales bacterium]
MSPPHHFITGTELKAAELNALLRRALEVKAAPRNGTEPLHGRNVALLFEKPSTRTRVSFQVGIQQMGGHALLMRSEELQLARGESVRDTALVLSRYVDAIVVRHGEHAVIEELARYADIPVVNALTPVHHPCQALADLLTLQERFGRLEGLRVAYVGDGNNVLQSLMLVGAQAGVQVVAATPPELRPDPALVSQAGDLANVVDDPREAAAGAHALYTDVWVSMGDEQDARRRRELLTPYRLDADLLSHARDDAIVMHCLPAHPGEEITEDLLYGDRSAVWDQAENRLHAQKALMELLLA